MEPFVIKRIAVLGAGVMGAQIAAHCINSGIETLLYDLSEGSDCSNAIVNKALDNLKKIKPSPLGVTQEVLQIKARNYEENLIELAECDLIIEAIAERMEWKKELYQRISPYLHNKSIMVTNTSGLSINSLANALPEQHRKRFCGVHFFNPPRYMHLAELIPAQGTPADLLDNLESWLTSFLGKGVVRANDTPNFIANRIGVFSLLSVMHHAEAMKLGFDEVDALTGSLIGRPKSATFRTMDVVGLDTMAHVVHTMQNQLQEDPWHPFYTLPEWFLSRINEGHLGQKSGQGIYRKKEKAIEVYDIHHGDYRPAQGTVSSEVLDIMKIKDPKERMQRLSQSHHKQAQFLIACFNDLFQYAACHLQAIAHSVRDVDLAMRWGFGWQQGPFELWQASGLKDVLNLIQKAREENKTLSNTALPKWLHHVNDFYVENAAFSPTVNNYVERNKLKVYERQFFPDRVLKETRYPVDTLYENDGVRLYHLKDEIVVASFKTKANTIGQAVLDGLNESLDVVEKNFQGLIIYQEDEHVFSSGADLRGVSALIKSGDFTGLEQMVQQFQELAMRLKYSFIPVVAAARGRALGGGYELLMHCARTVAGFEFYPGLVEAGVGLIPAGGGCKEMAIRAAFAAKDGDLLAFIKPYFERIATAAVATSAQDALNLGYLQSKDSWVMHANEVLFTAVAQIKMLLAANYLPPLPQKFKVAGREGHARLQVGLVNWLQGGFISQHDYFLANELAWVLCGGDVNEHETVDEQWMLKREREAFIKLARTPETQARIQQILEVGKPLRN